LEELFSANNVLRDQSAPKVLEFAKNVNQDFRLTSMQLNVYLVR